MALDFDSIAVNLARRFDPTVFPAIVIAPAGLTNIQGAAAYGPPAIVQLPFVIVNPPDSGALTFGGQERAGVHQFTVDFLGEGMADPAREAEMLAKWLGVLLDLTLNGVHLDLAAVVALTWTGRYE